MEKKEEVDPTEELNQALGEFENETPLNLTDGDKDDGEEDPEFAAKLQGEYEKFMNEMKNGGLESEEGLDGLADALGGLLKGLTDNFGMDGVSLTTCRKRARTSRTCWEGTSARATTWRTWPASCCRSS